MTVEEKIDEKIYEYCLHESNVDTQDLVYAIRDIAQWQRERCADKTVEDYYLTQTMTAMDWDALIDGILHAGETDAGKEKDHGE